MSDVFKTLNSVNVNDKTEKKNGMTYLSWAWAWGEVKKAYPSATYTIYENANGWNYHTDGRTCWVKTGVTIEGIEHIEYLPVMDYRNNSIPLEKVTSFDVNKAIQRSLTKAAARHGLGLYIYAGEDLPEEEAEAQKAEKQTKAKETPKAETDELIDEKKVASIRRGLERKGATETGILKQYGIKSLDACTMSVYLQIVKQLQAMPDKVRPQEMPNLGF